VRDRTPDQIAGSGCTGEGGGFLFHTQVNVFADKLEIAVPDESAREKPGFGENLKTIANPEDETALRGEIVHGGHHRTAFGYGTTAEIVTIAETSGDYHGVRFTETGIFVPDVGDTAPENIPDHMKTVLVTVGTGELKNNKLHEGMISRV
jgi:hypothetical protein